MKNIILVMALITASFYFYSNYSPSESDEKLDELRMELEAKEKILVEMEAFIENVVNNAKPQCEGGTIEVQPDRTPVMELQNEIETLKQKIAQIENP